MYYQPEQILELYDLNVKGIGKSRDGYVCETSAGKYLLQPFLGSVNRAMQIKAYTDYLQVEAMQLTKEGAVLADMGNGEVYCLKEYVSGRECNPLNIEDGTASMEALANFHNKMERYQGEFCEQQSPVPMAKRIEKRKRELIHNKNYIRNRRKKTSFETEFLAQYEAYVRELECAGEMADCLRKEPVVCLCHCDVNHHNLLHSPAKMMLTHYEHMQWEYPVTDIAMLLRKIMEKTNWDLHMGTQLLLAYERVRKLTEEEKQALSILMHIPERFCKISNHYFHTTKSWASERDVEKLWGLQEQKMRREAFLEKLFPF